jgi:hypothetical protein
MSEDLLRKLQMLEEEYSAQPLIVQQADLREINQIRNQLGIPLVDARLNEIGVAVRNRKPMPRAAKPKREAAEDHTEAREIYQAYQKKIAELEVHRAYAEQVVEATAGAGQTPVRPLATMGTDGGPLLCDHCGKPMVLEGGQFHGVAADVAWKENPSENWAAWILGGMVVEIQINGTLRIYHGYPGRNNSHCCNIASREEKKARARFKSRKGADQRDKIRAFLAHDFPDMTKEEHLDLLNKILDTMYSYDPGIGINRPRGESRERE